MDNVDLVMEGVSLQTFPGATVHSGILEHIGRDEFYYLQEIFDPNRTQLMITLIYDAINGKRQDEIGP